ncbi:MAG: hypothetical protein ACREV1_00690 [Gammaproteobacteria bacterium]
MGSCKTKIATTVFASILVVLSEPSVTVWAQDGLTDLRKVRTFETEDLLPGELYDFGNPSLLGLAFPPGANTLVVLRPGGAASVVLVAPRNNGKPSKQGLEIPDPINIAFDPAPRGAEKHGIFRLFLFGKHTDELITVKTDARGYMNGKTVRRFKVKELGVQDPQGMTFDTIDERLIILDRAGPRLVSIDAAPGREFDGKKAVRDGNISQVFLPANLGEMRGIAFNPTNGNLFIFGRAKKKLYELTVDGEIVTTRDIAGLGLENLQAMTFAPSVDRTDDPAVIDLYTATSSGSNGELTAWSLNAAPRRAQ